MGNRQLRMGHRFQLKRILTLSEHNEATGPWRCFVELAHRSEASPRCAPSALTSILSCTFRRLGGLVYLFSPLFVVSMISLSG